MFLILTPDIMIIVLVSHEKSSKILLSLQRWENLTLLLLQSTVLNEKISTNQKPGDNSLCKGLNENRILLR